MPPTPHNSIEKLAQGSVIVRKFYHKMTLESPIVRKFTNEMALGGSMARKCVYMYTRPLRGLVSIARSGMPPTPRHTIEEYFGPKMFGLQKLRMKLAWGAPS